VPSFFSTDWRALVSRPRSHAPCLWHQPWWVGVLGGMLALGAGAQPASTERIYRCGQTYTNLPTGADCQALPVPVLTVVPTWPGSLPAKSPAAEPMASARVAPQLQAQRDAQAREVLQAEWQRAQQRHAALMQEWNQGEPQRQPEELRQPGRYAERVAQLRAAIERSEADLAGLQRELKRLGDRP